MLAIRPPPHRCKRLELPAAHGQQQGVALVVFLGQLLVGLVLPGRAGKGLADSQRKVFSKIGDFPAPIGYCLLLK